MILDDIFKERRVQLERERGLYPRRGSFKAALRKSGGLSIIAEVKKASPSKSVIEPNYDPVKNALAYEQAGAAAVSVLTEERYFQGSIRDFSDVRAAVGIPLLRKDFVFDEFQIAQTLFLGGNAVLLIAAMLDSDKLYSLYNFASALGLDCLVEVHSADEVARIGFTPDIVGINNRDLTTFDVDLAVTERLAYAVKSRFPEAVVVSESGMTCASDLRRVRSAGADAVLIGETLMRSGQSGRTVAEVFGELLCS
ncbi:indole-3-glycerol-phosphate synthase [Clostridia bacterium]|nr:indole-3-glycerol-phosphate synthase [Clostridia bacterium]